MKWKVLWYPCLFCLFLSCIFTNNAAGQTRKKNTRVKKTGSKSIRTTKSEGELPGFARSPMPKSNYAFVVPRCSDDRQVIVFNIYRENLFHQKFLFMDGKLKLVNIDGSMTEDLSKTNNTEVYLLDKLVERTAPRFLQLHPGQDRMMSTIVLIKDKFSVDEVYQAYDQIKIHLTFLGFSVGFVSECNHLFLPEGQSPVQEQNKPPSD